MTEADIYDAEEKLHINISTSAGHQRLHWGGGCSMLLTSCTCSTIYLYKKIKHPQIGQVFKFDIGFDFCGGNKPWLKSAIKFDIGFNFGGRSEPPYWLHWTYLWARNSPGALIHVIPKKLKNCRYLPLYMHQPSLHKMFGGLPSSALKLEHIPDGHFK